MLLTAGLWFNTCNSLFIFHLMTPTCMSMPWTRQKLWGCGTALLYLSSTWDKYCLFRHYWTFSDKTISATKKHRANPQLCALWGNVHAHPMVLLSWSSTVAADLPGRCGDLQSPINASYNHQGWKRPSRPSCSWLACSWLCVGTGQPSLLQLLLPRPLAPGHLIKDS